MHLQQWHHQVCIVLAWLAVRYQSIHATSETFRRWEANLDSNNSHIAVIHRFEALSILQDCNIYILRGLVQPATSEDTSLSKTPRLIVPARLREEIAIGSTHAPLRADGMAPTTQYGYTVDLREVLVVGLDAGFVVLSQVKHSSTLP